MGCHWVLGLAGFVAEKLCVPSSGPPALEPAGDIHRLPRAPARPPWTAPSLPLKTAGCSQAVGPAELLPRQRCWAGEGSSCQTLSHPLHAGLACEVQGTSSMQGYRCPSVLCDPEQVKYPLWSSFLAYKIRSCCQQGHSSQLERCVRHKCTRAGGRRWVAAQTPPHRPPGGGQPPGGAFLQFS